MVTGTEVLSGRVPDRNGPWISEQLARLGVDVAHIVTVGDRPGDLEAALRFMATEGMDLVVTTGGLGPTADDLTAEVVARFAGRSLVLDEAMEARIAEILEGFARRFKFDREALREANRKQAMVPEGATPIDPAGTAPGLVVEAGPAVIVVLPGPPRELQTMWPKAIAVPEVQGVLARAGTYSTSTMRMFGIPESELAKSLREIGAERDLSTLEITTCLRRAELVIDIRYSPEDEELHAALREGLAERHPDHLFSHSGETIDEQVAELLRGHRIAVAESCTAGLLAARLTATPGASEYFAGGVVAYSNESKAELLDVDPGLLERHGAVSLEVAEAMAQGALDRFDADVACAVTGIAGPTGGTEEKPVGYVCFCVKRRDAKPILRDPVLPGNRDDIRERSTTVGMHLLRHALAGAELPF